LNEPLRAEIELLAATPEELNNLTIQLASQETFQRYDLERPLYLTRLQFQIVKSGRADGNVVRITSSEPVTEPFVTFLVEAAWSRGRLLREYTLLLDPPTFAPPPAAPATQPVTAPTRAAPADSGEIQRQAPPQAQTPPAARPPLQAPVRPPSQAPAQTTPQPEPAAPAPTPIAEPEIAPEPADSFGQPDFDTSSGGDLVIQRGDTLWGITQRVRPDSRLTINQTMLAIYEANPEAFAGNINRMRAGATLRIPSADDVFRISRSDAFLEVQRQNNEWRGGAALPQPAVIPAEPQPSLTLVPPDEEDDISLSDTSIDTGAGDAVEDQVDEEIVVDPVQERISELESILEDQDALIEIPSTELAALRAELAELRGEELPVEDTVEDLAPVEDLLNEDDVAVDDEILGDDTVEPEVAAAPQVVARQAPEEGLVDVLLGYLNNFWVWIGGALVATVGILFWFMRRAAKRDDEEATGVWEALDSDEMDPESLATTERLSALSRDDEESFVVVETQESPMLDMPELSDTMEAPVADEPEFPPMEEFSPAGGVDEASTVATDQASQTGVNKALEDTFSSETAINLDQTDPVAEADFHMAYGLYDQAADLINGALAADPDRQDLLAKLCEIYFVWGNRDAFIDAAGRLKTMAGGDSNPDWDKIVIMGQQIAGDHEMFTGVSAEGVTRAVDLSFEAGTEESSDLDMDFAGGPDSDASDVIDLGAQFGMDSDVVGDDTGQVLIPPDSGSGIDFSFEDEPDIEASATFEMPGSDADSLQTGSIADGETAEMPLAETNSEETAQTPTIEQQFEMEATGELPAISASDFPEIPSTDATAEIDLDDLGLDLGGLDESALAVDDDDEHGDDLDDTATSEGLELGDYLEETGTNAALDEADALAETGRNEAVAVGDELAATSRNKALDIDDLAATGLQQAIDATGIQEALDASGELPSFDDEESGIDSQLGDDQATMLASLDDDYDSGEDTDVGIDTSLLDATGQTQILTEDMAVATATGLNTDLSDADATMLAPGYGDEDTDVTMSDDVETLLAPLDDDDDEVDFDFAKTEALPKDVFSPDMSTDDTGRMPGLAGSTDMDLDLDDLTAALKVSEVGDTVNQVRDDATVEQPRLRPRATDDTAETGVTQTLAPEDMSDDLHEARTMTEVGTKLDLARAYVDMGDPGGARSILEEVLDEGDEGQKQQAQQLIDSLPA
jgi:pilus assembly protein FimV